MSSQPENAQAEGDLSGTVDLPSGPPTSNLEGTVNYGARRARDASGTHPLPPSMSSDSNVPTQGMTGEFSADLSAGTVIHSAPGSPDAPAGSSAHPRERYKLDRFHARGGMGEIWIATDPSICRSVAMKRMRPGLAHEHQQAFWLEAQITGQLEHPGVVPVHELAYDDEGQPYYVMKFVHGSTLEKVINDHHKRGPKDPSEREVERVRMLNMFISLCQTIGYAHSKRVIHRDIKPENVMIGSYGETLVLDWGLAKVLGTPEPGTDIAAISVTQSSESYQTAYGTIKGTPGYMSPESAEGDVSQVDEVSDIYLLGGTLYHILTGRRPRKADKLKDLIRMAQKEPPVPPRKIDPTVPKPLEAICVKATAMKKADRYQTAVALAEDVQRFLAGEPVTAYQESFSEKALRWVKRNWGLIGRSLMGLAVVGLVAFGLYQWRLIEQEHKSKQAALQADRDQKAREAEEAKAEADRLAARKRADEEMKRFQKLAEEARFFAANADPVAERAPFFDPERGLALARKALDVAEGWGPKLTNFPLDAEREPLKNDLADLLLLMAQVRGRQPEPAGSAKERLALLDRAAELRPPTAGYHQLRADALRAQDKGAEADKEKALAAKAVTTAMDHFLRAEGLRLERSDESKDENRLWRPNRPALEKAAAEYRLALRRDPKHYWSQFQLGRCLMSLGKGAEAAETLGGCIALKPEAPYGYNARGLALGLLGQHEDAKADLDQALNLDREFTIARLNHGVVAWQAKDTVQAMADFDAVLAEPAERRLIEAAFYRAEILIDQGKREEALKALDLIVASGRKIRPTHLVRARLLFHLNRDVEAMRALDAYLADYHPGLVKDAGPAMAKRGHLLLDVAGRLPAPKNGQVLARARLELLRAVTKRERSAELYTDLGTVCEYLGENDEAVKAYSLALEMEPNNIRTRVLRAWAYDKLQPPQRTKARDDFQTVLKANPAHAEAHSGLGYIQASLGNAAEANRHANLAMLHGGGDYLILHNVACIYAKLAQTDKERQTHLETLAIDQLRRAVELWNRDRNGPDELRQIQVESAFSEQLRDRPDFKALLKGRDAF
jgi:serine/threonine protein kinase/Flp pilus assembly protein TadD